MRPRRERWQLFIGNLGPAKDLNGTRITVQVAWVEMERDSVCFVAVLANLFFILVIGWRISKMASVGIPGRCLDREIQQYYDIKISNFSPFVYPASCSILRSYLKAQLHEDAAKQERQDGVGRYTIWVKNVPQNVFNTHTYRSFFRARGGQIHDVKLFFDNNNTLDLMVERGRTQIFYREVTISNLSPT